jgi:SAM-dependent methyltransferase
VVRCPACGLAQSVDAVTDLAALYDDDYVELLPADLTGREEGRLRRVLDLALKYAPPPGSSLEVGVGYGWLLKWGAQAGYEVLGVDLSPQVAERARLTSGARVLVGDLAGLGLPAQGFQAVLLRHVLEHVPEPLPFLAELRRLLAPGGVLCGAAPNFGSFKARLHKADWSHLMLPGHRLHFTPATLRLTLEKAGLEVLELRVRELVRYEVALFQQALNKLRRLLGRPPAPAGYDPEEVAVTSPVTWLLAQEHRFHLALARLGWGEEIVFAARRPRD